MKNTDIITKAKSLIDGKHCYWYGGKNNKCTQALLDSLSKAYPKVYTKKYIAKCKKDIEAGYTCIDCSGLVCYAYGVSWYGTSQFGKVFKTTKELKDGMIVWRSGHCGIYAGGTVIEAKGIDSDIVISPYKVNEWKRFYYLDGVDYGKETNNTEVKISTGMVSATKKIVPTKITWTVSASTLNIRKGPGTGYDIIGKVKKGEKVRWYGYCNNTATWIYVTNGTITGWVSKSYVC